MAARIGPRPTPRSSLSLNAPIRNPYEAFNASDFDSWIGGLTSSLRKALDHEDEFEDEDAVKQKSVTSALEAARGAGDETMVDTQGVTEVDEAGEEEESGSGEESMDEGVEDSFAHVNAVSARAKGKARDPRDGPGFGNSAVAPIELLDSDAEEEEEEEGEEEDDEEEEDGGEYEYEEEDEESWESDESEEDLNAPGSSKSHIERARRASEGDYYEDEEEDEEDEEEEEDEGGAAAPAAYPNDFTGADEEQEYDEVEAEDDVDVDAPELPDPWAPARTYAEDYYSGGDAPMRGESPSNLTPRLRAVSPGLHPAQHQAEAEVINVDDSDEEDEGQGGIRSSPIAEPEHETTAADRWDWNYPPAVPTGRHTTRPGHLATKDSEDALELLYPDEDDNGVSFGAERDAEEDYEGEQGQEYDEYEEEGEGEEEEEDLQAVKDRQKNMFVSAADVYSENGDAFDDEDGDAEAMEGDIPSPIRYRQEGTSFPVGDVYGDNNGGLFDTHSDSDSDIVEVSPPPTAREAVVSPILASVDNAVSPSPAPEAEEEQDALANPFGLPSFSAPMAASAPVPALSTAQASAALNAAPALPLGVVDYVDEDADDLAPALSVSAPDEVVVDSAPALSALESLASQAASSSPAGFSLHPAVWSPEETGGSEATAGHTEDSEEEEDEISEVQEAPERDVESELRAQLGPDVVLAGDGAPSLFADDGMYTDPGAPAYVPATPAVLDEPGTPASEVEGEEEAAPSIAAMPTIEEGTDRDPLEISTPDAENAPVPVMDEEKDEDEDDGMYTDPGAPAPVGEDAPMGYSAASSPLAPVAPSPAYVVEEPEDDAPTPTSPAARTAREESVATAAADGMVDKEYVVVEDEEDEVDEVESVVSAAEAEVEEPGEVAQEPGLSPVEEEEEDELVEDQQADDETHAEDKIPPPIMPYIPPMAARAIGEDVFGRPGLPFTPKHAASGLFTPKQTPSGLFTPKSEASGLFTPLEGSENGTSRDNSREDSPQSPAAERPHSPVVERNHSPTDTEKEDMRAAMREVERGAHEVYVGADEDDGEDVPSPVTARESPVHFVQEHERVPLEQEAESEQQEPQPIEESQPEPAMESPPIPTIEEPLGVPLPPPAVAQLAPFAGVDDFADLGLLPEFREDPENKSEAPPTGDMDFAAFLAESTNEADVAALDAFLANPMTEDTSVAPPTEIDGAQQVEADAAPEAFSVPDEAPETAAAAAAAVSEPTPHTVTVSLEDGAPEAKAVAVEDDPALEMDETEFGVQERKMDEEAGLTEDRDEDAGIKRLDPKLIEEAGDPFKLMGNASTVAPGAVSSGDVTPVDEERESSSEESKPDPLSVDNGLVLDEVALVQQLEPKPHEEVEAQEQPETEEEPKPVSKDFAAGDATPAPVDEDLLNGEQDQTEDADQKPIAALPAVEEKEKTDQTASQETEEAGSSQQTEVADDEERSESTPPVEEQGERSKSRKRKRISDEPARPRVTRSASSMTANGKNGAPKSKGKGKARIEEDEGASDASSALVHGLLAPSSRAGSVSSVDTDDRRPPLIQVDAHTEFIMHQHGRPRAAPTHLPQTIAQAQATQARTRVVATINPLPPVNESSRAASEEPASEPETPAPRTPTIESASAPPPSTENGVTRPAPPRRIPSKNTPVTRANCRFHTISFPREGGPRAHFVVPGCSMGDAKVIKEEDIRDEGFATTADHARMLPDVENLELDAYLVGNLRKLVGVDLLREQEVFYLPTEEEEPPRKKRRRHARKSTLDRVRTQSGAGKATQNQSRASTPSGSTDGGSVTGFARRRGASSAASSVADGYSTHEEEESEAESTAPKPKTKAPRPPVSDAGSQSTSASSAKSPRKRTLSTRRSTRVSRRLNPDALEYAPSHVEAAQEEQDQEDDVAPETSARRKGKARQGAKRSRTMEDVPAEGPRPKRTRTNTSLRKSMSVNQVNGKT